MLKNAHGDDAITYKPRGNIVIAEARTLHDHIIALIDGALRLSRAAYIFIDAYRMSNHFSGVFILYVQSVIILFEQSLCSNLVDIQHSMRATTTGSIYSVEKIARSIIVLIICGIFSSVTF